MTRTESEWSALLRAHVERPIVVRVGRSRRMPIQLLRPRPGSRSAPELRVHGAIERAIGGRERAEVDARGRDLVFAWVSATLENRTLTRGAKRELREWITARMAEVPAPRRVPTIDLDSRHHDLAALAAEVLAVHFDGQFDEPPPAVSWGRRGRSKSRHSLRLGSYDSRQHLIRIHPVLDQAAVPAWFVGSVLFHEYLHAALPPERDAAGRRLFHSPTFRRRERAHPDHERAQAWERRHLRALIRSAQTERPMR